MVELDYYKCSCSCIQYLLLLDQTNIMDFRSCCFRKVCSQQTWSSSVNVERLTLFCRSSDCTAECAEWSHLAVCPSWCRNLQTCRSVGRRERERQHSLNGAAWRFIQITFSPHVQTWHGTSDPTWFLSDMRKSNLDPGRPNSMKVLTSRRSALFPESDKRRHNV